LAFIVTHDGDRGLFEEDVSPEVVDLSLFLGFVDRMRWILVEDIT
jgi:hypothetical protein